MQTRGDKMRHGARSRWMAAVLVTASLGLSGCAQKNPPAISSEKSPAAKLDSSSGTGVSRVTLSKQAVERLAIQTVPIRQSTVTPPSGGMSVSRKVIPYAALLYDPNGNTWVYTRSAPQTYVRQQVAVDYIERNVAVLTEGPAQGTAVVTQGVPELYGAEIGIGEE